MLRSAVMTGDDVRDTIEKLLGTETTFKEERRAYKPQLCPGLANGEYPAACWL
jgi:hypothetical protein